MSRFVAALALLFSLTLTQEAMAVEKQYLTLELESGPVKIELLPEVAPGHVERVTALAAQVEAKRRENLRMRARSSSG